MVHSGYEATAVDDTFGRLGGFLATAKATLFNRYRDDDARSRRPASRRSARSYS